MLLVATATVWSPTRRAAIDPAVTLRRQ